MTRFVQDEQVEASIKSLHDAGHFGIIHKLREGMLRRVSLHRVAELKLQIGIHHSCTQVRIGGQGLDKA